MSDAISYFVLVILIDNNTDNKLLVTLIVHLPSNSERGDVRPRTIQMSMIKSITQKIVPSTKQSKTTKTLNDLTEQIFTI